VKSEKVKSQKCKTRKTDDFQLTTEIKKQQSIKMDYRQTLNGKFTSSLEPLNSKKLPPMICDSSEKEKAAIASRF